LKKLIVNADDFGFTRDVNEGIVAAHRRGILTATTIMATGPAFAHAVDLSRDNPDLDIGCHLVLVGSEGFPATVPALLYALATHRIRIYDELAAQVRRILDAGLRPTHLDTHKHTHLLPPVLDAVARGESFISTGEVVIPDAKLGGEGDSLIADVTVGYTFPLKMAEIVWGDGAATYRKTIPLEATREFGLSRRGYTAAHPPSTPRTAP